MPEEIITHECPMSSVMVVYNLNKSLSFIESMETIQQKLAALQAELGDGKWKKMIMPYVRPSKKKAIIQIINTF